MLSNAAIAALRDIAHHIDLAAQFAAGFDDDTFRADPRTVYAVTRCLEIISEASRRLPDELKARHPSIAWKEVAGAGQRLSPSI
ncbi:MAG: HepT-like ribonuclease domain-containing protein [Rhodospirillales bacterium]